MGPDITADALPVDARLSAATPGGTSAAQSHRGRPAMKTSTMAKANAMHRGGGVPVHSMWERWQSVGVHCLEFYKWRGTNANSQHWLMWLILCILNKVIIGVKLTTVSQGKAQCRCVYLGSAKTWRSKKKIKLCLYFDFYRVWRTLIHWFTLPTKQQSGIYIYKKRYWSFRTATFQVKNVLFLCFRF